MQYSTRKTHLAEIYCRVHFKYCDLPSPRLLITVFLVETGVSASACWWLKPKRLSNQMNPHLLDIGILRILFVQAWWSVVVRRISARPLKLMHPVMNDMKSKTACIAHYSVTRRNLSVAIRTRFSIFNLWSDAEVGTEAAPTASRKT